MRLYIIRHADSDYVNDTITQDGHLEAKALAERLASHGLDRIYCSPLGRAYATMSYTAQALNMKHNTEEWTRELPGLWYDESPWGAMSAWDIPGEAVRDGRVLPNHENWFQQEFIKSTKSKEVYEQLRQCSDNFLKRHGYEREGGRYRCIEPNREKIAMFCHCGFGISWIAHLLEIPLSLMWTGFWLAPTSVTTILFEERSKEWAVPRCLGLGDISHLYKAGIQEKPSGIKTNFY